MQVQLTLDTPTPMGMKKIIRDIDRFFSLGNDHGTEYFV